MSTLILQQRRKNPSREDLEEVHNLLSPQQQLESRSRHLVAHDSNWKVHFGKIINRMLQSITSSDIQGLLGLHCSLHDGMMSLEGLNVFKITLEDFLLDTLTETILGHKLDNLVGMLFLGVDPSNHLIHSERRSRECSVQLV